MRCQSYRRSTRIARSATGRETAQPASRRLGNLALSHFDFNAQSLTLVLQATDFAEMWFHLRYWGDAPSIDFAANLVHHILQTASRMTGPSFDRPIRSNLNMYVVIFFPSAQS
jgi:hypothetical protein